MRGYFAYTRVSTIRQGEKGSSLQEQKLAIEAYARRQGLIISQWFEEMETAAALGRPVFMQMLQALDQGQATGVITHKIDRSARNLRDWAALGDLVDRGVELHFAHESIDLSSRGGRLSADIQAVVAADYVRNLRDEVRKGFYGRLKQGFYPMHAPLGYLDMGGGQVKAIDPMRGPLIACAFELYASGHWSLETLGQELYDRGLRTRANNIVTRNGLSSILNNYFYIGIIRLKSTGETFQGRHVPLVSKSTFDQVHTVLSGKTTHRGLRHRFRYQRLLHCSDCGHALIAERQKGHVYYRCHTSSCPPTSIREEMVDGALRDSVPCFTLTEQEWDAVRYDVDVALGQRRSDAALNTQSLRLSLAATDDRLGRLTDAFVDRLIERDIYLQRKEKLLGERVELQDRMAACEAGMGEIRERVEKILELIKALGTMPILESDAKIREILESTTSNLTVRRKNVVVAWKNPFQELSKRPVVTDGAPVRIKPRTFVYRVYVNIIIAHCLSGKDQDGQSPPLEA
jgi:DNA invertase Pin-like site-specific DNA recombinase